MSHSLTTKLWIAVRFVLFGVGGFWLMILAWVHFLDHFTNHRVGSLWQLVFLPMGFIGAVLMLYGVGEWGRWAYLWVFLSIPLSMLLWFVPFYPQGKDAGALAPAVVAVSAYFLAKRYYLHRESRRSKPDVEKSR
jgi:hypothetical protein